MFPFWLSTLPLQMVSTTFWIYFNIIIIHIQYIHINIIHKNYKNDIERMTKGQWRPEKATHFEPKLNKNMKINVFE